jgi:hypothetical protein
MSDDKNGALSGEAKAELQKASAGLKAALESVRKMKTGIKAQDTVVEGLEKTAE